MRLNLLTGSFHKWCTEKIDFRWSPTIIAFDFPNTFYRFRKFYESCFLNWYGYANNRLNCKPASEKLKPVPAFSSFSCANIIKTAFCWMKHCLIRIIFTFWTANQQRSKHHRNKQLLSKISSVSMYGLSCHGRNKRCAVFGGQMKVDITILV